MLSFFISLSYIIWLFPWLLISSPSIYLHFFLIFMQESPRSPPLFLQDENLSKHLFFGFQLIREGTFLLDLQLSLSVDAQELLVDFYSNKWVNLSLIFFSLSLFFSISKSLEVYDVFSVSMACFLIASKAEGLKLSLRDVVLLFHFLHSHHRLNRGLSLSLSPEKETSEIIHAKLSRLDLSSAEYGGWKQELAGMEREVLTELGYRVQRDNEGFKYLESTILSLQLR